MDISYWVNFSGEYCLIQMLFWMHHIFQTVLFSLITLLFRSSTGVMTMVVEVDGRWGYCANTHMWFFFLSSFFSPFIFISWRLITLQYCSGFCHTLTWVSHGFTCIPHRDPPSHLPLHPISLGLPSAPAPSTCLMHPTWTGDVFHSR